MPAVVMQWAHAFDIFAVLVLAIGSSRKTYGEDDATNQWYVEWIKSMIYDWMRKNNRAARAARI